LYLKCIFDTKQKYTELKQQGVKKNKNK
jgi:hypothetical protein